MTTRRTSDISLSPEVRDWGMRKMKEDGAYIQHAAQYGSPLVRSIANIVLQIAEQEQKNQ
jgi:hypothetical protein